VTDVSGGRYHSCAVVSGGVKCWGFNSFGQLGDGTNTNSSTPVSTIATGSGVTAVSAGYYHSCAVVSGGVKCWGYDSFGQLGDGTNLNSSTPISTIAAGRGSTAIAAAYYHSCAVVQGGAKCWGGTDYPVLGLDRSSGTIRNVYGLSRLSLKFLSRGGSSVPPVAFTSGMTIAAEPKAPTKVGYTFGGWCTVDDENPISFPYAELTNTSSDVTLEATWIASSNKVTFNSKGGSAVAAGSFITGGTVAEPVAPARWGNTFAGWSATFGGSTVSFPYSPGTAGAIMLYAKWNRNSYSVTFNSTGGSAVAAGSFLIGGTLDAPVDPSRPGYTFAGWAIRQGGPSVSFPYRPNVTKDITLYAKWVSLSTK
jgi:uncharacterized repeat protein (TIGR02543 family)